MSKERELLRRMTSHSGSVIPSHFINEIKELLAQPEKEQEPLAWLITATSCGGAQDWKFVSLERKAPEKLERMFPKFTPLYTSPQKREPLSEDEIVALWANKSPANEFECVRLVEKAHGITGVGNE